MAGKKKGAIKKPREDRTRTQSELKKASEAQGPYNPEGDWIAVRPELPQHALAIASINEGRCVFCGGALESKRRGPMKVHIQRCAGCGWSWDWPSKTYAVFGRWVSQPT